MVSDFKSNPLNTFELIFACESRIGSSVVAWHMAVSAFPSPFIEETVIFPLYHCALDVDF